MQKKQPPFFIIIASLTTITAIFWILASVLITFRKDSIEPTVEESILKQLTPILDSETLDKLNSRVFFENSFINQNNLLVPDPVEEEITEPETTPAPEPSP